jgi:hypothetical protein
VTDLYLYALAGESLGVGLGEGLAGEPLRWVGAGGPGAIVGEAGEKPAVTPEALAAHDAVVQRLAGVIPALLPARFGQTVSGETDLLTWLSTRRKELEEALTLVDGCVQMTLRVFAGPDAPDEVDTPEPPDESLGPGARYMQARREAAARARALPEIAPLREALRPFLRAERVERPRSATSGRLRATAYDLVKRGEAEIYARTVAEAAPHLDVWKVTATGPWPPYAFAPALS